MCVNDVLQTQQLNMNCCAALIYNNRPDHFIISPNLNLTWSQRWADMTSLWWAIIERETVCEHKRWTTHSGSVDVIHQKTRSQPPRWKFLLWSNGLFDWWSSWYQTDRQVRTESPSVSRRVCCSNLFPVTPVVRDHSWHNHKPWF